MASGEAVDQSVCAVKVCTACQHYSKMVTKLMKRQSSSIKIVVKIFVWHVPQTKRLTQLKAPLVNIYLCCKLL